MRTDGRLHRVHRDGSCRNVYSQLRRASGATSVRGVPGSSSASIARTLEPAVDRVDLPRSPIGLAMYFRLLATTTDAISYSAGRSVLM
mmetsp:Transcript_8406/g.17004  ORF Transcript_8406/g.17004 Transcript_8406/m.17004 type:complete len:88 (-) Transcript_8406:239-502(-)|eukprot:CAMPEP_0174697938 /NCGR_PEP_ID=MMETSP1094-20130205/3665_1 /TAXON_ID=156173 /ORGANISM="Chrysochromulina brevifilum, Strain UTEX LB 985" /LENGTH=87 /DNA_ID=CAMNT_0015895023 /DNA_START=363 /DNA_END=626 /DNA_ORIENTATION=-